MRVLYKIFKTVLARIFIVITGHQIRKTMIFIALLCSVLINKVLADQVKYQVVIESGTVNILNHIKKNAKITNVAKKPMSDIITWVGTQLLNSPYSYYLLDERTPEYLYISLSKTDCMLFVEEVVVLARLIQSQELNLDNYINGIKKIRYHGNVSYCNRNHYFKDWAVMNESQNILEDVGLKLTGKTLPNTAHILGDVIARNESNIHYSNLACIRDREKILDRETIGFIDIKYLPKYLKFIKSGDIIGVVTSNPIRSDSIRHVGIAYVKSGKVGYLNASSIKSKVVIYDNLMKYLIKHKDAGIILFRVK
ncbi:MAG: N-acetylmuramoyl-L-alanine amidase-like domain-containing protein [Neisseriaceae bacterium]